MCLELDKVKEMELMQITDYNRLFELNKKLFQELKEETDEEGEKSDNEDMKYEMKNNLQFVQENAVN